MEEYKQLIRKCPIDVDLLVWINDREEEVATLTELSMLLSVSHRRVERWYRRRESTGFPEAAYWYQRGVRQQPKLWRAREVVKWRENWVPKVGGAPVGNRNNVSGKPKDLGLTR